MAENASTETVDAVVVGSGFRRLGRGLPPGRRGPLGRRPRARPRLPARQLPAHAERDRAELLGAVRGPARPVRRLELRGHRRPGLQRPGRWLADLRQRAAAQGREVVRPRAAAAGRRLRALADLPRRPRAPLRRGRVDDRRHAVPLRRHPQDDGDRGGRRGAPACRCSGRRWRSASRAGRGRSRCGRARSSRRRTATSTACPASPARSWASATWAATTAPRTPSTTPTSPRPSTPAPTSAPATRSRASGRSTCRGRRLRGHVRRAHRRRRRARGRPARAHHPRTAAGAGRGHLRHDVPAAAQPAGPARPERRPRHPLHRQRRPARPRHGLLARRLGPRPGRQHRPGHHHRDPDRRRGRRRRHDRSGSLPRGRRLPGLRGLARRERQGPGHPRPGLPVRLPAGGRGHARHRRLHRRRRPRRDDRAGQRSPRPRCRCSAWAATSPTA